MASVKIASLFLRTLSKPISQKLKQQAKEHEKFRELSINFAQKLHRAEMTMRVKLLGEISAPRHVRPLSEAKALENAANFVSEAFLFSFAAAIILGENWRSRRKEGKRRDAVAESLEQHENELKELRQLLQDEKFEREEILKREQSLSSIVNEIVGIGVRGGFMETTPEWENHNRLGELAKVFGTLDRRKTLGEEDDTQAQEAEAKSTQNLIGEEAGETLKAPERTRASVIEELRKSGTSRWPLQDATKNDTN